MAEKRRTGRAWRLRKLTLGGGQVEGESHPMAKMTEADVALARLIAADRSQPRGWITEMAIALGVSDVAIVQAIGGRNWRGIADPPPIPSFQRHKAGRRGRPLCATCRHAKYYAMLNGRPCRDGFHSIDHRQFTSGRNARTARRVQRQMRRRS